MTDKDKTVDEINMTIPCLYCHTTPPCPHVPSDKPVNCGCGWRCPHDAAEKLASAPADKTVGGRTPQNAQHEPPFDGVFTVTMTLRDPNMVAHLRSDRCEQEAPHMIVDCGEFFQRLGVRDTHSRGLRDGLERAAKLVTEGAKAFRDNPAARDRETAGLLGRLAAAIRAEASKLDGEEPKRGSYLVVHKPDNECDMLGVHRVNACLKPNPPGPSPEIHTEERKLPLGCPGYESTEGRDDFCTRVIERVRGERFCARPRSAHSPTTEEER